MGMVSNKFLICENTTYKVALLTKNPKEMYEMMNKSPILNIKHNISMNPIEQYYFNKSNKNIC